MSEQIKRTDIAEEGVLDNLLKPLKDLKTLLDESDKGLKSFADTVINKLDFSGKAKELREFTEAEEKLNKVYEEKKRVQRSTMDADNEIAKLKEKLNKLTTEEAKEIAALKVQISEQNRELRQNAKAVENNTQAYSQFAKQTRDAKNESKELGAQLKLLERDGKQNTDAYRELANQYEQATQKAAQLDKELKEIDKSVGDNFRNVGNYESALNALNKEVAQGGLSFRELRQRVKQYQDIAIQAGKSTPIGQQAIKDASILQDQLDSLTAQTRALADDGANMKAALTLGTAITQGYQGLLSVQALLGVQSEELLAILTKIQATQGILNSLNAVRNALDKDSVLVLKGKIIAQKAYNFVMRGTAAATNTANKGMIALRASMLAIPIMAIVAGLTALVSWLSKAKDETDELAEAEKRLNDEFERGNDIREQRIRTNQEIDGLVKISNKLSQTQLKNLKSQIEQEIALSEAKDAKLKLAREEISEFKNAKSIQEALKSAQSDLLKIDKEIAKESGRRRTVLQQERLGIKETIKLLSGQLLEEEKAIELKKQGLQLSDDEIANIEKRKQQLAKVTSLIREETKAVKENNKTKRKAVEASFEEEETKDAGKALKERLKAQEEALQRQFLQRRMNNIKTIDDQEEFNKAELENEVQLIDELIALRKDYQDQIETDTLELELQRAELLQEFRQEEIQDLEESLYKSVENIAHAITDVYNQAADNAIASFRRQEEAAARMYGTFEKLAAEGNITATQSLAEMNDRIEEQQRRQMQAEQRKLRMQQAQQVSSILLNQLDQGKSPGEALAAAGAFLAASKTVLASLPSFDVGTENTSGGGRGVDGKGGFLAINHPNERIMTAEQNKKVGGLSNPMLADIAYKYRTGQLNDYAGNSYDLIELKQELQGIKQAIQNQPQQVVGLEESLSGMVEMIVKNKTKNHTRTTSYKA